MLNRFALFIAAAAAFGLSPLASRLGPVAGSALLVVVGVLMALAASGTASAVAITAGAVGAFASGVLGSVSPAVAGAVLVAACYAERTLRVRGATARAAHVGLALIAGAMAGAVSSHYVAAELTVRAVVVVVAAVLSALPLLLDADQPLAHALEALADALPEPCKSSLREGAELCRTAEPALLDRAATRDAHKTWRSLLRLAQARVRLERAKAERPRRAPAQAVIARIDDKIGAHVQALSRMYTAVDEARAAEASLDDGALRSIETSGESLEQMSRAIVEDV
jgi:hypothetical protein